MKTDPQLHKDVVDELRWDPRVRNAELDARQIEVETTGGKVTLEGKVRSWAERVDAEHAAWGAPGVKEVDDRLVVSSTTF